jgi:NTP pyrophosphatase (non-canonical NTP hydrolase)
MNGHEFEKLFAIAQRKHRFDETNPWCEGSQTYFSGLHSEIHEVAQELADGHREDLEEELGDVLWDYLNLLLCLNKEDKISIDAVLNRTIDKFEERVSGIEQGEAWSAIKARQKQRRFSSAT